MSYQLEREMHYRVARYQDEAAVRRALPRREFRRRLATGLRRLADYIEERAVSNSVEQTTVVLQGRNL